MKDKMAEMVSEVFGQEIKRHGFVVFLTSSLVSSCQTWVPVLAYPYELQQMEPHLRGLGSLVYEVLLVESQVLMMVGIP
jgi:ABC-type enterochelin transport system permease subunit